MLNPSPGPPPTFGRARPHSSQRRCSALSNRLKDMACSQTLLRHKQVKKGLTTYVFDHAWAEAFERHGIKYYPKGLLAVPFSPVTGPRLIAAAHEDRVLLARG